MKLCCAAGGEHVGRESAKTTSLHASHFFNPYRPHIFSLSMYGGLCAHMCLFKRDYASLCMLCVLVLVSGGTQVEAR